MEKVQTNNNRTQEDILEVSRKLHEAYKNEDNFWQQKNCNMWYTSWDLNTKFYHAITKHLRARNRIVGLYDTDDGNWIIEEKV